MGTITRTQAESIAKHMEAEYESTRLEFEGDALVVEWGHQDRERIATVSPDGTYDVPEWLVTEYRYADTY